MSVLQFVMLESTPADESESIRSSPGGPFPRAGRYAAWSFSNAPLAARCFSLLAAMMGLRVFRFSIDDALKLREISTLAHVARQDAQSEASGRPAIEDAYMMAGPDAGAANGERRARRPTSWLAVARDFLP